MRVPILTGAVLLLVGLHAGAVPAALAPPVPLPGWATKEAPLRYTPEDLYEYIDGAAEALRANEDVREFYLGVVGENRRSFKNVKTYKRRKRWLA